MKRFLLPLTIIAVLLGINACTEDGPSGPSISDFDRQAMLTHWADNFIIPAYNDLQQSTLLMASANNTFQQKPTVKNLQSLRDAWKQAYLSWQRTSMFEAGPAMEVRLRSNLNIYPTNSDEIESNIASDDYNLELPSQIDAQGFPAIDYLINGIAESDSATTVLYADNESYRTYLTDLITRISTLSASVTSAWEQGYRSTFITNSGNSSSSSIDMMVNDYIFYYEKALRAGKVGFPAGVFSNDPMPTHTEAYYQGDLSRELLVEALKASQNFFNGSAIIGGAASDGPSLSDYLEYLESSKNGTSLSDLINDTFTRSITASEGLNANFSEQIETNNTKMLETYDILQENVILMKVDMLQALNINVDYVDADGD